MTASIDPSVPVVDGVAPAPRVSVEYSLIIATLGRHAGLTQCLTSLADAGSGPSFEVIVVDQNEADSLCPLVAEFSASLAITHARVPFRGVSRARNHGAGLARGRILGFPDDDCRFLPDTLGRVDLAFADRTVAVVSGQTVGDDGIPNFLRYQQVKALTCWTIFGRLLESALYVDRSLFLRTGGFDERFGQGAAYPASEGYDLVSRLLAAMGERTAVYDPSVRIYHPAKIPPWDRGTVARFYSYAVGDGAFYAKHLGIRTICWFWRDLAVTAGRVLLSTQWWRSVAHGARVLGVMRGFVAYGLAQRRA